ncbi:hypothetical protein ACFLU5_06090 [Bacteroidota bacterium]
MSVLFSSTRINDLEIKNRFIHSATYESMATSTGQVTDRLIKRYRRLAKGEVGLIIPGYMFVHPFGKAASLQTGIHKDDMIPGLKNLVDAVHEEDGKIVFQLAHGGRQTVKSLAGRQPMGPSSEGRDPVNNVKPAAMTEMEIQDAIQAFRDAARRTVEAGADGVQLHAAHGYLISEFMSPFFNLRNDDWGGSDEKRFRFLKEVILSVRKEMPTGMPLLIKLNSNDFTPNEGVTPALAVRYVAWLSEMDVDLIEVSSGSVYSMFSCFRGEIPVKELVEGMPWWKKPLAKMILGKMVGKFDLEEGYNLDAAKMIKESAGNKATSVVGGFRRLSHMKEVVEQGHSDFISMSRPFIREPYIVKEFKEGKKEIVACQSCNKCVAAINNSKPVRCYSNGTSRTTNDE